METASFRNEIEQLNKEMTELSARTQMAGIVWFVSLFAFFIIASAFALSFHTLSKAAVEYGYLTWWEPLLWPILVDVTVAVCLVVEIFAVTKKPRKWNLALLTLTEFTSIAINLNAGWEHGQTFTDSFIGALIHGLPVVIIFGFGKVFTGIIHERLEAKGAVNLEEQKDELQQRKWALFESMQDSVQTSLSEVQTSLSEVQTELAQAQAELQEKIDEKAKLVARIAEIRDAVIANGGTL